MAKQPKTKPGQAPKGGSGGGKPAAPQAPGKQIRVPVKK